MFTTDYLSLPIFTLASLPFFLPLFTRVYLCSLVFAYDSLCSPMFTHIYSLFTYFYSCLLMLPLFACACVPTFTHVYSCIPMFTLAYLCLPLFTYV